MNIISSRGARILVTAAALSGLVAGCNSSSSSSSSGGTSATGTALKGNVIDGYVKNATVTAYSDKAMTAEIGSGTTDASGNFNITLSAAAPATVYIMTSGGTNIDTGMPAPTMYFQGASSGGSLHVTPLTTVISNKTTTTDLSTVEGQVASDLSLTTSDLYGDPETDTTLQSALARALASGTQQSTLSPGTYKIAFASFDTRDIGAPISKFFSSGQFNLGVADATVANDGTISGSSGSGSNADVIDGKVQGNTVIFNVEDSKTSPTYVNRVAGTVGLFGDTSGNFTRITNLGSTPTASDLKRGTFVASFMPSSGVDSGNLTSAIQDLYQGHKYRVLFSQVFGNGEVMGWGNVTFNTVTGTTVKTTDITIGAVHGNNTATVATSNFGTLTYNATDSGVYSVTSGGTAYPADVMVIHYDMSQGNTSAGGVYMILVPGSRRGMYVATDTGGTITGVGNVFLARTDGLIPSLKANTQYDMQIAAVGPWSVGQTRTNAMQSSTFQLSDPNGQVGTYIDTSSMATSSDGTATASVPILGEFLFDGSMMGIKQDINEDNLAEHGNGNSDAAMVAEMSDSGAMFGERQEGGCFTINSTTGQFNEEDCGTGSNHLDPSQPGVMRLKNWPTVFVSYTFEKGAAIPTFTGKLKLLARALYARSYSNFNNAYHVGTLDIGAKTTTMTASDQGQTVTGTLTTDVKNGMYHMYGQLGTNAGYFDFFWPVGSPKALYLVSDSATGNVEEEGEAFISR